MQESSGDGAVPPLSLTRVLPYSSSGATRANVKRGTGDLLVDNAPYGRAFHSAVVNSSGRALYDLVTLAEPPGAIALAIDSTSRVALLRHWRPVPAARPSMKSAFEFCTEDVKRGFWSLEVPRGFPNTDEHPADTAKREAREELGVVVSRVVELGFCNFNTSLMLSDIPLYAVLVRRDVAVGFERDEAEQIAEVRWYTIGEIAAVIASGEIRCGLTLAALVHFFASREKLDKLIAEGDV